MSADIVSIVSALVVNDLAREIKQAPTLEACPIPPVRLVALATLIADKTITRQAAKAIQKDMLVCSDHPRDIAERQGLLNTTTTDDLAVIIHQLLIAPDHQATLQKVKDGNDKALNALIGPAMALLKGKADPKEIRTLLQRAVEKL